MLVFGNIYVVLHRQCRPVVYDCDEAARLALAEIVRQRLGIAEEDPAEIAAAKLAEGLDQLIAADQTERAYIGSRLGRLLGVAFAGDSGAALGREELFAGWRLFFERLAAVQPVVLLIEDAQYADSGLLDFLDHLIDWVRDLPVYVLVFARPELSQARSGFGSGRNRRKPAPTAPAVPKPRTISRALLTHPDRLSGDGALIVKNATAGCAHLERLQQYVRSFAKIMAQRRGTELPAWLQTIEADDLPELRSLAAGMRRDLAAVTNGLTLEHSSGAVEGNVTRIKRIKRDGYGRANFDLLRAQILIAA